MNNEQTGTPETSDSGRPKPLTPMENVILTVKVLAGAGAVAGVIWVVDRFLG